MKTIIEYYGKYYLAERVEKGCKDKCAGCPLNSPCADEDNSSAMNNFCDEYGLHKSMHITKELTKLDE